MRQNLIGERRVCSSICVKFIFDTYGTNRKIKYSATYASFFYRGDIQFLLNNIKGYTGLIQLGDFFMFI
ncbi:MAG TPA: hypothetical protein PLI57_03755 [Spirochaetota bacterium]|nr:hypothetical protein [Spirochaetota bacterium]